MNPARREEFLFQSKEQASIPDSKNLKRMCNMKKAMAIALLAILVVTFLMASEQKIEELKGGLRVAIMFGKIDEVKRLVKAGADLNEKFDFGMHRDITHLLLACMFSWEKSAEIVKVLIDAGADVNVEWKGMNLLHVAVEHAGDEAVIEPLVANGLDINEMNKAGQTPLYGAAFHGKIEWAETLIKNGADLNATEEYKRGQTPLHVAILKKHKEVAELLIAKGADVNAKDKFLYTPLDYAISKNHKELADLLRKHGGVSGKK